MIKKILCFTMAIIMTLTIMVVPAFGEGEETSTEAQIEKTMDFLYLESTSIEAPGIQNVALAWNDSIEGAEDLTLIYEDEEGNGYEATESSRSEESVLFEMYFGLEQAGKYKLRGLRYTIGDEVNYLELSELGMTPEFEVTSPESNMTMALQEVELTTTAKDVVVVLDPGHGGSENGATYGGIKEKTINLKIAKYLKAELETYDGVKVYLTRSGDSTLTHEQRAKVAKKYNADVLISIHNNAVDEEGTGGAEAWYPNTTGGKAEHNTLGKNLSKAILSELEELGLYNRGVETKSQSDGKDWYGIIRKCRNYGIPAIIVEHAFLDNTDERAKYLSTDESLKQLGVADATAIAGYFKLSRNYINEDGRIVDKSGNIVESSWALVNGSYYHTDSAGFPQVGFQTIDDKLYYLGTDGAAAKGWIVVSGESYYCSNDKGLLKVDGVYTIGKYKYGFDSDGKMYSGETVTIGDYKYMFSDSGKMIIYTAKAKSKITSRKGPGTKYAKTGNIAKNTKLKVIRKSGLWSQLTDGRWIKTKYRKGTVSYPKFVSFKIKTNHKGYYRKGAGSKYKSSGTYGVGTILTVVGEKGNWYKLKNGKWIYKSYVDRYDTASESNTLSLDIQSGNDLANSWRYENGQLVDEQAVMGGSNVTFAPLGFQIMAKRTSEEATGLGIDVSKWQGDIDWEKVYKSGKIDFVIIRCGYGTNSTKYDDAKWEKNVAACEKYGIPYGVYLYSYATSSSNAKSEANHALRLLKGHNPDYPVYYDLEDKTVKAKGKSNITSYANTFCSMIEDAGYEAGIYANLNWWNNYLSDSSLDNYDKWVAQWSSACTYAKSYSLWQYTSSGSVSGISGRVDMNYDFADRFTINDADQILNSDGDVVTSSWSKIKGKYYYTDEEGYILKGFQTIDNKLYYLGEDGGASKGWKTLEDGNIVYCYTKKGLIRTSGIYKIGKYKYGFDSNGYRYTDETVALNDKKYIFLENGRMVLYKAKTKSKVTTRSGAGKKYSKKGTLKKGTAITVVRKSGSWSQLSDGRWMLTKYRTGTVKYPKFIAYKVVTIKKGYYRAGASTKYKKKGSYKVGVTLKIKGRSSDNKWGKISSKKWVYLPYTERYVEPVVEE